MVRVMVVGLGPIGMWCARAIRAERDQKLVAIVDIDPRKVGKSLSQLTEGPNPNVSEDPVVIDDLDTALDAGVDVAIVTTTSDFAELAPTITLLLDRKVAVLSSCEQMVWPWYQHAELADQIDAHARRVGCPVLAAGVNPGFVMDNLAVVLSSMIRRVRSVRCIRRVNASLRRQPLQAKVGSAMSRQEFERLASQNKIGHAGLAESVALLAAGLGRKVQPGSVEVTLEPEIADRPLDSALGLIQPGRVCGIHNIGKWQGDGLSIELDLTMRIDLQDPKDIIEIGGPVCVTMKIPGGLPGDSATVAALLNQVPNLGRIRPGLLTMLDMPPAGCRLRDIERVISRDGV